jgi:hypothetical protein
MLRDGRIPLLSDARSAAELTFVAHNRRTRVIKSRDPVIAISREIALVSA